MRYLIFAAFVCLLLLDVPIWSQQLPLASGQPQGNTIASSDTGWIPRPIRDTKSVQMIQAALIALGGVKAIEQFQSCTIQGQVQLYSPQENAMGSFVWRVAGSEFRGDFSGPEGTSSLASGHGKPFRQAKGATKSIPQEFARVYFVPPLVAPILFAEFQNPNYSLQYVGSGNIGSAAVNIVVTSSQASWSDSRLTLQTWYFDAASGLPIRIEYRLPDVNHPTHSVPVTVELSDYRPTLGSLYPFQAVKSKAGKAWESIVVDSIQPNSPIDSSIFDAATGGVQ